MTTTVTAKKSNGKGAKTTDGLPPSFSLSPAPSLQELLDEVARLNAGNLATSSNKRRDDFRDASWNLAAALSFARIAKGNELYSALIEVGAAMAKVNLKLSRKPGARAGGDGSARARTAHNIQQEHRVRKAWNAEAEKGNKTPASAVALETDMTATQVRTIAQRINLMPRRAPRK